MLTGIQYFSLQRLSGRVFWAFVVLASLMLLTGIGANFSLDQAETSNTRQISRLRQVTDVNTLRAYLYEETNTLNLIILYKVNGVVEYTGLNTIRTKATIEQMSQDFPEGDEANASFSSILNLYSDITNRFSAAVNKKLSPQEETDLYNQVKQDYDSLTSQVSDLLNSRQQAADTARNSYLALVNTTRLAYVIISMVLFMLALFFAYLVARLLASPLARLTNQLRLIATGNLSKQMELKGSDEVLELSFIFNRTIFNLKNAISRIQQQVRNIGQASQQIIDSSDSQVASLTEQAEAVAETSTTAVQLSDTGEQIAESAEQVAASANFALASANRCYELMLSTNETMNEIREKANQTALTILSLNEVAQRIRDVSILIDNFSNETHLLALNAAIESAGAGVEGERFAVVAGHVRRLAQRSKVAAVEIQQLVRQIQQSAISSVMATEESTKVAELGEKRVLESLQANEVIVAQISQTAQLAEAISLATQQQRSASSLVASRMLRLNEISNSISLSGQAYVASANRLGEVVNELNAVVSSFVVDELAATLLGPDSESLMAAALPAYSTI